MPAPMMVCGCRAQGTRGPDHVPCCIIHGTTEVVAEPHLEGRVARCSCGNEKPSTHPHLAFFEYLGDGSYEATELCGHCGYHVDAHSDRPCPTCDGIGTRTFTAQAGPNAGTSTTTTCPRCKGDGIWHRVACDEFVAKGDRGHDRYYCGCRGWD